MLDPRRVAGLLDVPGCRRRQAVDAAMIDTATLTASFNLPPGGRSPYAHERNGTFGQLAVQALPELTSRHWSIPDGPVREGLPLAEVLHGSDGVYLLRGIVLPLGGQRMHVGRLVVSVVSRRLHVIEIRSYAIVDGHADPDKVAGTAREIAAIVLGLRQAAAAHGVDPHRVDDCALLVLPRNFGLTPVATPLDVSAQLRRLRRLIERLAQAPAVPADPRLLPAALPQIPARYGDGCPSCPLHPFCADRVARAGSPAQAGSTVVNVCGPVDTVERALALAHGEAEPADDTEHAIAAELSRAAHAHRWAGHVSSGRAAS